MAEHQAGALSRRLGQEARRRREARGWSQEDLAQAMHGHGFRWYQSTVNRIETGGRTVSFDEAAALALVLDLGLDAMAATDLHRAIAEHQELALALGAAEVACAELRQRVAEAETFVKSILRDQAQYPLTFQRPPDLTEEELAAIEAREATPAAKSRRDRAEAAAEESRRRRTN